MNPEQKRSQKTRRALLEHLQSYPELQTQDVFKYLHHSAMGCEHLVSDAHTALAYIQKEYRALPKDLPPIVEPLDGEYCRVHLSWLNAGLSPATLARLFCLSAKDAPRGKELLEQKLQAAGQLVQQGLLPLDGQEFEASLAAWREQGYPALHHSPQFREKYHPAYRVIKSRYATLLPLLAKIDKQLASGNVTLAVEGGSASGKSTLASMLQEIYHCTVFHMDDFFLQPAQRTAARLSEPGGNVDRERFLDEVLTPLTARAPITYRPYDCAAQELGKPITLLPAPLTVIEGVYAMHPLLRPHYTLSVFLDVASDTQRERILHRNSPVMASRYLEQWIPLEQTYFSAMEVRQACSLCLELAADS